MAVKKKISLTEGNTAQPALGRGNAQTTAQTAAAERKDMSFKVAQDFRKRFRDLAHDAEISQIALLYRCVEAYEKQNNKERQ